MQVNPPPIYEVEEVLIEDDELLMLSLGFASDATEGISCREVAVIELEAGRP